MNEYMLVKMLKYCLKNNSRHCVVREADLKSLLLQWVQVLAENSVIKELVSEQIYKIL